MMAQHHNNPVSLVDSRLGPSQIPQGIPQDFPQGTIDGNPNPGQPSQVNPTPGVQMLDGTTLQEKKFAALRELRDRAIHLYTNIKHIEQQQAALASQRSTMNEGVFLQKMAITEQDIVRKRNVLTKWNMMLSANGAPPIGQGIGQMNPPGPPSQSSVIPPQNTQNRSAWDSGTQQNQTLGVSDQSSPPPDVQQPMGSYMNIEQHNFPQVPQQNPGNAMTPPQSQPDQSGILAPLSTLQSFAGTSVPPLDRSRFQGSYRHFCSTKKLVISEAALNIAGKQVDLYTLHEEVFKLRAIDRTAPNFWHLIGSKLGFSFGEEPASDEVAVRVATIYKQFLHQFDTIYVALLMSQHPQMPAQNSLANAIPNPGTSRGRPSQEQINNAAMFVQRTKRDYMTRNIAAMRFTNVPEVQRQEYSTVFDNLWRFVIEVDPKMTMYAVLLPEDLVRRLIAMVLTCQQQQSLLSSNPPKYLLELPALKMITSQIQECIVLFNRALAAMNDRGALEVGSSAEIANVLDGNLWEHMMQLRLDS